MKNYNSKIFWHFTGGPDLSDLSDEEWALINHPDDVIRLRDIKSKEKAWKAMQGIIDSKELWATSAEKLHGGYETNKFCCVADLYPEELQSHRKYYGDFAIGFHPNTMMHIKFNPVLYMSSLVLKFLNAKWIKKSKTLSLEELHEEGLNPNVTELIAKLPNGQYNLTLPLPEFPKNKNNEFSKLERGLMDYIKYSYPSSKPGFSFFQEKEWRCFDDFKFRIKDIAKVIVPENYLEKAASLLSRVDEEKRISLISWEFLDKT